MKKKASICVVGGNFPSCSQCYIWPKIPSVILTQHRQNLTPNNQQLKHDGMLGDFN